MKYVLPVTVGAGVAVGLGYWVWTTRDRVLHYSDHKTIKVLPDRQQTHAIRVPAHLVPALIGTGGENIHQLEADTRTSIHFGDEIKYADSGEQTTDSSSPLASDDDWVDEPPIKKSKKSALLGSRLMTITGSPEGIGQVTKVVDALIRENTVEPFPIPDGCNIVGVDGATINQIQAESGAKVKLDGNKYTSNRSALLIGNEEERTEAKRLIQEVVDHFLKEQLQTGGDHSQ